MMAAIHQSFLDLIPHASKVIYAPHAGHLLVYVGGAAYTYILKEDGELQAGADVNHTPESWNITAQIREAIDCSNFFTVQYHPLRNDLMNVRKTLRSKFG